MSNSYKNVNVWASQVADIPFDEMLLGRRRYNNSKFDTCHSSLDRLTALRDASSLIKRINKCGSLNLSSSYLQIYN